MKPKMILISMTILTLIQKKALHVAKTSGFQLLLLVLICSIHLIALNNGRVPGSPGVLTALGRAAVLVCSVVKGAQCSRTVPITCISGHL